MKLWIHPLAVDELDEASAWYDAQELGLGDELVEEVQQGLRWIEERPLAGPPIPSILDIVSSTSGGSLISFLSA